MKDVPKVAVQGEEGSFSQEAGLKYWGKSVDFKPKRTFEEVIKSIENDEAEYGILPIENSLIGSISTTYDLLLESNLSIVGEVVSDVSHYLLGIKKLPVKEIRKIYFELKKQEK